MPRLAFHHPVPPTAFIEPPTTKSSLRLVGPVLAAQRKPHQPLFARELRKAYFPQGIDVVVEGRSTRCLPQGVYHRLERLLRNTRADVLRATPAPDNRPIRFKVATPPKESHKHSTLVTVIAGIFYAALNMRDMPEMADVDCYEVIDVVRNMPNREAVKYLRAFSRWLTEVRIAHESGPKARSFSAIFEEGKRFTN